jgi:hypothetical protein
MVFNMTSFQLTKCSGEPFPLYTPLRPRPPTRLIDIKRELGVAEKKVLLDPVYCHWADALSLRNEIETGIGRIQQTLRIKCLNDVSRQWRTCDRTSLP